MRMRGTTPTSGVTSTQSSAMQPAIRETSFEIIAALKVSSTRASSVASAAGVSSGIGSVGAFMRPVSAEPAAGVL
jgi:hypothetical protein